MLDRIIQRGEQSLVMTQLTQSLVVAVEREEERKKKRTFLMIDAPAESASKVLFHSKQHPAPAHLTSNKQHAKTVRQVVERLASNKQHAKTVRQVVER